MIALHITSSALGENHHYYFDTIESALEKLSWYKERALKTWYKDMYVSCDTASEFYFDTSNHTERYYIQKINLSKTI